MENPSNIQPDQVIVVEGDAGFVPKAEPSDAGKVLGVVNASGDVGWVEASGGQLTQVQADWAETDPTQVSYIDNKPDLSVYATSSAVDTALAGKQDVINDLSDIRSGASAGATAVQPSALDSYATTSAMNTALAGKQDVINDLSDIRAGASAGATAVQPAALEDYATVSAMNTALAGKQDVISDLSDIRAGAALGATAAQPSDLPSSDELLPSASSGDAGKILSVDNQGNPEWITLSGGTTYSAGDGIGIDANNVISADVDGTTIGIDASTKKIKSLQSIPSKTSDLQNDSGFITSSDIPAQVNADWTSNSGASEILHKPDLSIYAQSANLATVATTGDYDDLVNKPTIPAAQVNSDWSASSGVAAILNKPSLATVATTGDYSDLLNKPSIPAAQVNADWNSSSGVSEILNKPTIPSGDELVPSATSVDAGKVLTVDSQGSPSWVTPSGGTTYSAGDGIAIDGNNVISADVDGMTIGIDSTTKKIKLLSTIPSVDQSYSAVSTNAQSGVAVAEAIAAIPAPSVDEVPAVTSSDDGKVLTASYSGGTGSYSWAASSVPASKPLVAGSNITLTENTNDVTIAATDTTYTAGDGIDITSGVVSADVDGSTIGIDSTTKKIKLLSTIPTVDQNYNASSTNAQSGTAVASAISGINAVPASTSADQDKVLTVNSSGTPVWAAAQGGGGSGAPQKVSLEDNDFWESYLRTSIGSDTSNGIFLAYFYDNTYDPSTITAITDVYTVSQVTDFDANIWLFKYAASNSSPFSIVDVNSVITSNYRILALAYSKYGHSYDAHMTIISGNSFSTAYCTKIGNIFPNPNTTAYTVSTSTSADVYVNTGTKTEEIGTVDLSGYVVPDNTAITIRFVGPNSTGNALRKVEKIVLADSNRGRINFSNAFRSTRIVTAPPIVSSYDRTMPVVLDRSDCSYAFYACGNLVECNWILNLSAWKYYVYLSGSNYITDCSYMFNDCRMLEKAPVLRCSDIVRSADASYATYYIGDVNLSHMFFQCYSLNKIEVYNVLGVSAIASTETISGLNLDYAFYKTALTEYPGFLVNTESGVKTAEALATSSTSEFEGCSFLKTVPTAGWSVTFKPHGNMQNMFKNAYQIENSDKLYTELSASVDSSTVTTGLFTNTGSMAEDYATKSVQIPSSWGGTGA